MFSAVMDPAGAGQNATAARRCWALLGLLASEQEGRGFLWHVPALALGIGAYFALPFEPGLPVAALAAILGLLCLWRLGNSAIAMLSGMVLLGFALARIEAAQYGAPLLASVTGEVTVTGEVVAIDQSARDRQVMILDVVSIEGVAERDHPARLRLSVPGAAVPPEAKTAGAQLRLKARLAPLPSPAAPGGFDFGRSLYFNGIGGTGRITSEISVLATRSDWSQRFGDWLARLRTTIGNRIHQVLPDPSASFANALITGERGSIPPEVNRSLMVSGLYHILSISGLHMWLVAGGVFWAVRATLALSPYLALGYPIRKWAAAAAMAMAFFYLLLAESGVATTRAFIMVAVVFFAVMVDRPALSMRNLALAGLCVLLVQPHAAVSASFQMSFLAVMGLIAFYEVWSRHRAGRPASESRGNWVVRALNMAMVAFAVSVLTAFIAGVCSTIPAAYHFGRISPYSVLANGLAIPVVGCLVMPAAVISVLMMPLGLEWLSLTLMGHGLDAVVMISDAVARLPGADAVVQRPPAVATLMLGAGLIMLCLLAGPARVAGLAVMGFGLGVALMPPAGPDLLVEATGRNVALRNSSGLLVPAHARRGRFAVDAWLQENGEEVRLAEAARRPGWSCRDKVCEAKVKGRRVVYVSEWEVPPPGCADADILIVDFPLRGSCSAASLRIDRFDLWRFGAHAIWLEDSEVLIRTSRGEQGDRPWTVLPRPRVRSAGLRGD
ncbi:ComEC/Rec2 family competence protein [Aestuariivirga sp.]|jgi:competence protein ComEC|uniref:ComEC/Rec2 family competence protein n=1 Tax=Aestuariivirga sp. TaxID=2650926 RepID=UPI003783169F